MQCHDLDEDMSWMFNSGLHGTRGSGESSLLIEDSTGSVMDDGVSLSSVVAMSGKATLSPVFSDEALYPDNLANKLRASYSLPWIKAEASTRSLYIIPDSGGSDVDNFLWQS